MVYVDNMKASFRGMKMCHMIADTTEELLAMAKKIGVESKWIQCPDSTKEHFDICMSARAKAVASGAKEITWKEAGNMIIERNKNNTVLKKRILIVSNGDDHYRYFVKRLINAGVYEKGVDRVPIHLFEADGVRGRSNANSIFFVLDGSCCRKNFDELMYTLQSRRIKYIECSDRVSEDTLLEMIKNN